MLALADKAQTMMASEVPSSQPAKVKLAGVHKSFGDGAVTALQDITLEVKEGEFVSIVGPSGCGKSTILKLISGLTPASQGTVGVDGSAVSGPPEGVGFMFQSDALLPWATVTENILVGLELGPCVASRRKERVAELIGIVGLTGFEGAYPSALSGGMRQRVSLARTLAYEPSLFLMDEPFGALDAQTKILLGQEFLRIWARERRTVMFVTHDLFEAITMSDRILVMSARPGSIVAEFSVDLPRPRDFRVSRGTEEFAKLYDRLWFALMGSADSGVDAGGVSAAAQRKERK